MHTNNLERLGEHIVKFESDIPLRMFNPILNTIGCFSRLFPILEGYTREQKVIISTELSKDFLTLGVNFSGRMMYKRDGAHRLNSHTFWATLRKSKELKFS